LILRDHGQELVIVCRRCHRFKVYRGTVLCAACTEEMATGWPEEKTP
jgi:hypothetical protein